MENYSYQPPTYQGEETPKIQFIEPGQVISFDEPNAPRNTQRLKSWILFMYVASAIHACLGILCLLGLLGIGLLFVMQGFAGYMGARKLSMSMLVMLISFSCIVELVLFILMFNAEQADWLWFFLMALYAPLVIAPSGMLHQLRKFTEDEIIQLRTAVAGNYNIFH